MAVPSILSVTPTEGISTGGNLVEILGTNFRPQPDPPPTGPSDPLPRTVAVTFGADLADDVRVQEDGRLSCLAPRFLGEPEAVPALINVTVENLDDNGVPIAGESVTTADAYTYRRPELVEESDLQRLVRELTRELKRHVLLNVAITTQTDFDSDMADQLNIADLSELPALVLVGPRLTGNRFYSVNRLDEQIAGIELWSRRRSPHTVDLEFGVFGVSDHTTELLNLMPALVRYMRDTPDISMLRDPAAPEEGRVKWEMDFTPGGEPNVTTSPNESNVRTFAGTLVIKGFDIERAGGVEVERGRTLFAGDELPEVNMEGL